MQLQTTNITEHPEEYQSQEEIKQLEKCIFAFCYGGSPLLHGCKLAKFWLPPHQAIFSSLRRADLNGRKSNSAAAFYFWKLNSQISSQNKPTPILMTLWIEQNRLLLLALFRLSVGAWEAREHYTKTPQVSLRAQTCTYPIFGHWPLPAQFSLGHPTALKQQSSSISWMKSLTPGSYKTHHTILDGFVWSVHITKHGGTYEYLTCRTRSIGEESLEKLGPDSDAEYTTWTNKPLPFE